MAPGRCKVTGASAASRTNSGLENWETPGGTQGREEKSRSTGLDPQLWDRASPVASPPPHPASTPFPRACRNGGVQ